MATPSPLRRAKKYGYERPHVEILYAIAAWFNSFPFEISGSKHRIGTHYEPSLQDLVASNSNFSWTDAHEQAHQSMIRSGVFKSKERDEWPYVAGRLCRWSPTVNGMRIIEDVLAEVSDIEPFWKQDHHRRPPLYRDGNELLTHRKGSLVAFRSFNSLPYISGVALYPRIHYGDEVPDGRIFHENHESGFVARFEVITNHNNRDTWVAKRKTWAGPNGEPTIWIFENRTIMVRFFNHLHQHEDLIETSASLDLHGGTFDGDPNNWAAKKVNDRLLRSWSKLSSTNYSDDAVWTLPGLLRADSVDVHEWANKNNLLH